MERLFTCPRPDIPISGLIAPGPKMAPYAGAAYQIAGTHTHTHCAANEHPYSLAERMREGVGGRARAQKSVLTCRACQDRLHSSVYVYYSAAFLTDCLTG